MAATTTVPSRGVRAALGEMIAPIAAVFRNRNLRRIELAFAGSVIGDWAYATAVTVWAYGVGGARAVGIWAAVRLISMAIVSPIAASVTDRLERKKVMVTADLTRAVLVVAATLCLFADTPAAPVFVLATLVSLIGCVFRPAQAALMPSLADTPEQLTAANGASSTFESVGFFLGPALGALLLTVASIETVYLVNAATFVWSMLLVLGVRPHVDAAEDGASAGGEGSDEDEERPGAFAEMAAGFTTIFGDGNLRLVAVIVCLQTIIAGASAVFGVLLAVEILETGPRGVGYVDGMLGVGAVIGGLVAIARASKHRLAFDMAIGTLLWSLPLLIVAWQPHPVVALAVMALLGLGNPLVDVSFFTIVQRITPDQVLGRVFGAMEGVLIGTMALGSALMPLLVDQFGLRDALSIIAVVVGVPTILLLPLCRRLDGRLRPPEGLELLRGLPMFAPLGPARLEAIARQLQRVTVPSGEVVIQEGGESDRFYVIEAGAVAVTQAGTLLRREGPGDFFGEIGLLRDVPRTATITTTEDTTMLVLERADFLGALAGNDEGNRAVDDVITRRLGF
ncbi:MAG TPA: MFS transporter [Marmoricola sp.]|nr:MFS transporter [Marmoricola sp.]